MLMLMLVVLHTYAAVMLMVRAGVSVRVITEACCWSGRGGEAQAGLQGHAACR